ncbi:hypothetical protein [Glycomyces albidus]|uniref:PE domain-containing protein n=1 Tax=Glycomyces albidus TaxID=2656774 RepID=A0A6L5G7V9_9ACTN|nr:hypothetical protein [Glycomyces albidus]MQM25734.1 hypothetical protein [Glycomyces albidus]
MTQERVFDAEAVEEYRQFLLGLLDQLEGQVIPVLAAGTLSRAPAFGTAPGAADNAAVRYQEFHAATWRNLQYLRGTLHGMEAALAEVAGGGTEADDEATLAITDAGATPGTGGSVPDGSGTYLIDGSGTAPTDGGTDSAISLADGGSDAGTTGLVDGGGASVVAETAAAEVTAT